MHVLLAMTTNAFLLLGSIVHATPITISSPSVDRWNSAVNFTPGYRATASAFSVDAPGVENFFATQLLLFDISALIPPGKNTMNYSIRSANLTLHRDQTTSYIYDPSFDPRDVYTSGARDDPGHPIELYGAAFQGEFSALTYVEGTPETTGTPWGPSGLPPFTPGVRYAYPTDALGGTNRDVSSHTTAGFEVTPFAIGTIAGLRPGDLVNGPGSMQFDLALTPNVVTYLQQSLNDGVIGFHVASHIVPTGSGNADFPSFYNKESSLDSASLMLNAVLVPEPTSGLLLGSGLLGLLVAHRLKPIQHTKR